MDRELCERCGGNGVIPVRRDRKIVGTTVCPACEGRCWADAPPQPAPRVCVRCKQADALDWYCGAHGHCRKCSMLTCNAPAMAAFAAQRQPPPAGKFEEALRAMHDAMPPHGCAGRCLEEVRAAHKEARASHRDCTKGALLLAVEARAAGVADGRREMAKEVIERLPGFAGEVIDHCEAEELRLWLEAQAREEKP